MLHEGLIATLDDELIEEDYDDIQEKKFTRICLLYTSDAADES